eukprot:gene32217-33328_t
MLQAPPPSADAKGVGSMLRAADAHPLSMPPPAGMIRVLHPTGKCLNHPGWCLPSADFQLARVTPLRADQPVGDQVHHCEVLYLLPPVAPPSSQPPPAPAPARVRPTPTPAPAAAFALHQPLHPQPFALHQPLHPQPFALHQPLHPQ